MVLPNGLFSGTNNQDDTLKALRNWDLYGPLLLCMTLSIILSFSTDEKQASYVFATVFVIIWCGSAIVTLNAQLLGGKVSFFQSTCVLGYCVFPLVISAILCRFLPKSAIWKSIVVGIGFVWSTRASVVFMSQLVNDDRKVLASYPVFLFYIAIGWIIFASE